MRVLWLIVVGAAAVVAAYVDVPMPDDTTLKERQMFVLKLLNHIMDPVMYKDIQDIGRNYSIENHMDMYSNTDVVKRMLTNMRGGYLPPGEIFCLYCGKQMQDVIDMFHVLFYAKDFKTFMDTACWMRMHMNEGMFVYAFTVALRHRTDCKYLILPPPYEIYPYFFVHADVVKHAYMIKMKQGLLDKNYCELYGIKKMENDIYVIDENIYDQRHGVNSEIRLKYFTEDIGLNTYYYYFHVNYPFWMNDDVYTASGSGDRRGELTYYVYHQLLARYHLERLSHNMCDVKPMSFYKPLKTGFWANMKFHNGMEMPMRYNNYVVFREDNVDTMSLVEDYEKLIREAILKGYVMMHDGTKLEIKKPEHMETLARMVHGKVDKYHSDFYWYLIVLIKSLFGQDTMHQDEKYMVLPTTLDQYQTALRDPVFWQLQRRLMDYFTLFKIRLPSYTTEELHFPGVNVNNVVVDKLVTYFDHSLMDMTNVVTLSAEEMKKAKSDMTIMVRKRRLNHQPFTVSIDVMSDKAVDSVVRIFLGPKTDCMGRFVNFEDNHHNFVEMDTFKYKLTIGKNTIIRKSTDMNNLVRDRLMTRNWMPKLDTAFDFENMLMHDMKNTHTGFPMRLVLPMGHVGGMEMMMYVIVSPLMMPETEKPVCTNCHHKTMDCCYSTMFDNMPLGFPMDRPIDASKFFTPNMKFVEVMIYHKNAMCDMKMRWERHVLKSYNLDRISHADDYYNTTDM